MLNLTFFKKPSAPIIVGAFLLLFVSSANEDEVKMAHFIDSLLISLHQEIELSLLVQRRSNDLSIKRFARKVIRKNHSDIKLLTSWREEYFPNEKTIFDDHQLKLDNLMDLKDRQFDDVYIEKMIKQMDQMILLMKRKVKNKKYSYLNAYLQRNKKLVKKRRSELKKEI